MIERITACVGFYLTIVSCFEFLFVSRKKKRTFIAFSTIILFCILWRSFGYTTSSRYYSSLIFLFLLLSALATKDLLGVLKKYVAAKIAFAFFLGIMLTLHLLKLFSSFNNVYILDLQDKTKEILAYNPQDTVIVYSKEFERIHNDPNMIEKKDYIDLDDTPNFSVYYFKNAYFPHALYYIDVKKHDALEPEQAAQHTDLPSHVSPKLYGKIEHFITNTKHTKSISVYKHSAYMPTPDAISPLLNDTTLKAFIPEYDTFVYQKENELFWLIGADIDKKAEVIYHIYTDRIDLLPEKRKKYGFDNRGFIIGKANNEIEPIGKYRVFKKEIPPEYPIRKIYCGFSIDGVITRCIYFTVSQ